MFQALYNVITLIALVVLFIQTKNLSDTVTNIEDYLSSEDEDDLSDPQ